MKKWKRNREPSESRFESKIWSHDHHNGKARWNRLPPIHIFFWFSFIPISHILGTIFSCVALMAKRKNDPNFFIHPASSQGPLDSGLTYDIWSFQAGVTQHSVKPPTQVISIILRTRNSECVNWAILALSLRTNYISWHLVEINVVVALAKCRWRVVASGVVALRWMPVIAVMNTRPRPHWLIHFHFPEPFSLLDFSQYWCWRIVGMCDYW